MNLKFYTSVGKGLKPKDKFFLGIIPTFVEVTVEKLVGRGGGGVGELFASPILNRVKEILLKNFVIFQTIYKKFIRISIYYVYRRVAT